MSDNTPRDPNGNRRYAMDYIPNHDLYKAVMFARKMIRDGTPAGVANTRAASYYGVDVSQVAHYVGLVGGTHAQRKRRGR